MIKTYDGTSFKRLGGKPGDKSPAVGVKRPRTLYTAVGGETSINLSSTSPAISYLPGNAQISVKRSSGGALISGIDFFELTSSSIGFPSTDPLVAGEVVEIIQDVVITAVMAAVVRPDAFTATGVLGQTLITADFSWAYNLNPSKGIGAVEVCLHGLSLTRGVDYTEVNLSVANTNQITLVDPLVGGENIQILPLYQALDTSAAATSFNGTQIASIQAGLSAGTQAFVDTSSLISVPNTTIVGRAPIVNIAADLRASFGVERIQVQSIVQLQNEFGPNGEPVFSAVNDDRGLIRLVGSWAQITDSRGNRAFSSLVADYLEVTFFGTGLNMMIDPYQTSFTGSYSVDGSSSSTFFSTTSISQILARNYASNTLLPVISGLVLGVHTVKINFSVGAINPYGFEILNTASATSLNVNPGSAYISGQKLTSSSASAIAYNSAFETGTLGTRGGHVVVYQKSDGTIGKAVTAVNASSAFLAAADHTNEEIVRTYNPREFGAGRSDDFSSSNSTGNYAFTLDDGTTTLVASQGHMYASSGSPFGVNPDTGGSYITFMFVGTGLDIQLYDSAPGGSDTYTYQIDGATAQAWPYTAGSTALRTQKLVSGLPYGTHTFRVNRVTAATWSPVLVAFKVYQPKKPSVPTGAVELADYNVLANFIANTVEGTLPISTGVLRKLATREITYVGSISFATVDPAHLCGFGIRSGAVGDYAEYTFFGTGLDLRYYGGSGAFNFTANVVIDGSANLSGFTTSVYGSGCSFSAGPTALLTVGTTGGYGCGLVISGLTLGLHKIRVTCASRGTNGMVLPDTMDIITPIYSAKSNTAFDQQNTLPVGSNSLSDNRKTSLIKDAGLQKKNIAFSTAVQGGPTTTSTSFTPCPDLSVTHQNLSGRILVTLNTQSVGNSANQLINYYLYIDGVAQSGAYFAARSYAAGHDVDIGFALPFNVSPGTHKIDIYWSTGSGTATAYSRTISVIEL